jgi:hypothetical protein
VLGFSSKTRRGVIVLSNCRDSSIVTPIWRPIHDNRSPKSPSTITIDETFYDRYVGRYQTTQREICSVRRAGDRLLLQWLGLPGQRPRNPSYEVFPQSESLFSNEFWGVQAMFVSDSNNQGVKLILTSRGPYSGFKDPINLSRISTDVPEILAPFQPSSSIYDGFVGRYRKAFLFGFLHLGPTLSISNEKDDLGNHLIATVRGVPGYNFAEFFPMSESHFVVNPVTTGDDIQFTFVRDKKGETIGVDVSWNGKKLRGARISHKSTN